MPCFLLLFFLIHSGLQCMHIARLRAAKNRLYGVCIGRQRQPRATAAERVTPAGNDPRKLRLSALKGLWRFFSQAEPVAFPFFP